MKKGINIDGELKEEGSTANVLNIESAKQGIDLTEFIRLELNKIALKIKKNEQ